MAVPQIKKTFASLSGRVWSNGSVHARGSIAKVFAAMEKDGTVPALGKAEVI